jgi:hypothetical protein
LKASVVLLVGAEAEHLKQVLPQVVRQVEEVLTVVVATYRMVSEKYVTKTNAC